MRVISDRARYCVGKHRACYVWHTGQISSHFGYYGWSPVSGRGLIELLIQPHTASRSLTSFWSNEEVYLVDIEIESQLALQYRCKLKWHNVGPLHILNLRRCDACETVFTNDLFVCFVFLICPLSWESFTVQKSKQRLSHAHNVIKAAFSFSKIFIELQLINK